MHVRYIDVRGTMVVAVTAARCFRGEERMSFVTTQPELLTVAAGSLLGIGSAMTDREH